MPDHTAISEVLSRAALFQGVPANAVTAAIDTRLRSEDISRGHVVFAEGTVGDRLYIVIAGKVKIGSLMPNGRTNLITVMGPSDMFGEISIFDPGRRTSSATALTDVHAVSMDRTAVREWIAERPEIADQLLRVMARRVQRTNDHVVDMGLADVAGRVARQLLVLARRFGVQEEGALRVTHELTQSEFGQLVGASRETVNKAMSDFAQRGWIRSEGRSVVILDSERLANRTRTIVDIQADASPRGLTAAAVSAQAHVSAPIGERTPRVTYVMRRKRIRIGARMPNSVREILPGLPGSNTA